MFKTFFTKQSIEEYVTIAIKDGNVRAMQRFVSDATWETEKMTTNLKVG